VNYHGLVWTRFDLDFVFGLLVLTL